MCNTVDNNDKFINLFHVQMTIILLLRSLSIMQFRIKLINISVDFGSTFKNGLITSSRPMIRLFDFAESGALLRSLERQFSNA